AETIVAFYSVVFFWHYIEWILIGWLVARAYRTHAAAMVLMVAASRPFTGMLYDVYYSLAGWHPFRGYHDHPEFILITLITLAQHTVLMLAGGLLVRPKIGPEQPPATIAHAVS